MVVRDRDRLAADLQSSVVQRIFAAGLNLQGVLPLVPEAEVRRRVQSPVPEITFTGPVDDALPPEDADQLLDMLRLALGSIGTHSAQTSIRVEAGKSLRVVVTGTGQELRSANGNGTTRDFSPLRERASQDGVPIAVEPVAGGTRLAWSLPLRPGLPRALGRRSPVSTANAPDRRPCAGIRLAWQARGSAFRAPARGDLVMMKTIDDLAVAGLRVLVRADLNVPLDGGRVADDGRIRASLPTLTALTSRGASVIVCAHLGRPGGKPDPRYSLAPVAARLGELLGERVELAADVPAARAAVAALRPGGLVMLENLRFDAAETSKDDAQRGLFADQLAELADLYVADGFGAVHRKHASVYDVALRLPHAAGYLVQAEVAALSRLTADIRRPYVMVLGGAKVADKFDAIGSLLATADRILIGGAMAFPFLAACGYKTGDSLLEASEVEAAAGYLDEAAPGQIELPSDVIVAAEITAGAPHYVVAADAIPFGQMGLDIGPESAARFAADLRDAKTVFWNGPMGVFELAPYAGGTRAVARAMTGGDAFTVVGGGDTGAAIRALGFAGDVFGYVSTGGGASLEFIQGKTLPGLAVLADQ